MKKRVTKSYPLEFKKSSAKLAVERDQPYSETAKDLGVHTATLHGWIVRFYPNRQMESKSQEAPSYKELQVLRRENSRLRQERDILKKAAAYFAKGIV